MTQNTDDIKHRILCRNHEINRFGKRVVEVLAVNGESTIWPWRDIRPTNAREQDEYIGGLSNQCPGVDWARLFSEAIVGQESVFEALENGDRVAEVAGVAGGVRQKRIPAPLRRPIESAPSFPTDALGDLLAAMAERMQQVIKAPDALCGQSVLSGATLASQAHRDIEIDGRRSPISNYNLTLGESSERKSSCDTWALKPHREWEETVLVQDNEAETFAYENKRDAYKKSCDEILKREKSYQGRADKPRHRILYVGEELS